jgi:5,10-methylenetetrahydrofolate reductase
MYSHLLSRTLIGLDCIFLIVGFMIVSSCRKLIYFNALGRGSPPPEFLKKALSVCLSSIQCKEKRLMWMDFCYVFPMELVA